MVSSGVLELSGLGTLGAASGSVAVSGGVLDLGGTTQTEKWGPHAERRSDRERERFLLAEISHFSRARLART